MRHFNLKSITILIILILILVIPYVVFAQDDAGAAAKSRLENVAKNTYEPQMTEGAIGDIVGKVINAFLAIVGIIFLSYMIYGGYLWMTAGGNDEKVTKAKVMIRNSIIGIIIVVGAYAITYFVLTALTGGTAGGGIGTGS